MNSDREDPAERGVSHDDPDDLQYVYHHAELPETRFSRAVDGALKRMGSWVSWFWIALMAVICVNVFMKNALGEGSVRFEEIQWHIYSALFLLGLSYTLVCDDHVRVDLLYENFGLRTRAWVDLLGIGLFLLPFLAVMIWFTWPFVLKAWMDSERSVSPAGLSHYWIIKSALLSGLSLLAVAALSRAHRCFALLFLGARPAPRTGKEG